jgi:hypothetical protein
MGPYRKNRKIKVHIDKYDTWSMDYTLAHIIHPMLVQLKETKQGSPYIDDEDVPENLRSTNSSPKENQWDIDDFFHDRWDWVLDEMIWSFERKIDDNWKDEYYKNKDYNRLREKEDRMKNAFRLFGKYYEGLWN